MTHEPSSALDAAQIAAVTTTDQLARLLRQLRRRQARQRSGPELTYRELAAHTGWSIGTLAGYFGGRILPPTDRFDILVGLLDATPAERGMLATARDRAHEHRRRAKPASAPPAPPVPRQLPAAGFPFAGRARELSELDALLDGGHTDTAATGTVAVICGSAGVGKPIARF